MAASTIIGNLRVNLGLDSAEFQSGAVRAQGSMRRFEQSTAQMSRASTGLSGSLRGVTQQLSQVGQQTMATGNFIQALAIQLPDIGLAFGAIGTAVGLVAGIALPMLASALTGAGGGARTFQEALSNLDESIKATDGAVKLLSGSSEELKLQFGSVSEAVRSMVEAQAIIGLREMSDEADSLISVLAGENDGNAWLNVSRAEELYRAFDLVGNQSQILAQQLVNLRDAATLEDQIAAATTIRQSFEAMVGPAANMTSEQFKFYSSLIDTESALSRVSVRTAEINRLLQEGGNLLSLMQGLASNTASAVGGIGAAASGIIPNLVAAANAMWDMAAAQNATNQSLFAQASLNYSAGGGMDGAVAASIEAQGNAALAATRPIRTYGAAIREAGGAAGGAAGAVQELASVQDTLNEILADASDPIQEAQDRMQELYDGLGDGIGGAIRELADSGFRDFKSFTDSLVSTFSDAVAKMVADAAAAQLGQTLGGFGGPIGSIIGGLAGGLFSGLFGRRSSSSDNSEANARARERASLETELLELQGRTNRLRARELASLDPSNRALQERVWALQDEQRAAAEAREAQRELNQERRAERRDAREDRRALREDRQALREQRQDERGGLQERLWQLLGRTNRLRERELASLDPANRALQQRIWAIEDEQAAAEAAAEKTRTRLEERQTLEEQLWELQGRTDLLRQRELSELDPANRAIQERIWALQDEKEAAEKTSAAIDDLVNSISTDQFASLFEYERAIGRARNGGFSPSASSAVAAGTIPAVMTSANANSGMSDGVLSSILSKMSRMEAVIRKWDGDGLPLERSYA